MTGGRCYKRGSERGAWYELKCLHETIAALEASGGDAGWERQLLAAWLKVPEYSAGEKELRGMGFFSGSALLGGQQRVVSKIKTGTKHTAANYETSNSFETSTSPVLSPDDEMSGQVEVQKRGRPRSTGEVSRVTAWRRKKEQAVQGVLV